jgi:hypothetical protein
MESQNECIRETKAKLTQRCNSAQQSEAELREQNIKNEETTKSLNMEIA